METVFISLLCILALISVFAPLFRSNDKKPKPSGQWAKYDELWQKHGREFEALFLELQSRLGGTIERPQTRDLILRIDQAPLYRTIRLTPSTEAWFSMNYWRSDLKYVWFGGGYGDVGVARIEVLRKLAEGLFDRDNPELAERARSYKEAETERIRWEAKLENRTRDEVNFAKREIDSYWKKKKEDFDDHMEDRPNEDDYWTPR